MITGLSAPFWASLLAKMIATAGIVVAVSTVVERVGPFLGAMIATLPISAGPALVFVAIDHGPAFLGASAQMALPAFAAAQTKAFAWNSAMIACLSRSKTISRLRANRGGRASRELRRCLKKR